MNEPLVVDGHLLVTPEEAARRLSLGRTTVYELISNGKLASVRIGRSRRVPVSSLSMFVDSLIETANDQPGHPPSRSRAADRRWGVAGVSTQLRQEPRSGPL